MDAEVTRQLADAYPSLGRAQASIVYSSVHDVFRVTSPNADYALKVYRSGLRSRDVVEWEAALHSHLHARGAPVPALVPGAQGLVEEMLVASVLRLTVLTSWAEGAKPSASPTTYRMVGRAAAELHEVADEFRLPCPKPPMTYETEVGSYLEVLRPVLERCGRVDQVSGALPREALRLP